MITGGRVHITNEDAVNKWYAWDFLPEAFAINGINDNPNYLSLAMVPNSLNKSSSWWLVSSFASKENLINPHPYLEVEAVPEPSSLFLLSFGLLGAGFLFRRYLS